MSLCELSPKPITEATVESVADEEAINSLEAHLPTLDDAIQAEEYFGDADDPAVVFENQMAALALASYENEERVFYHSMSSDDDDEDSYYSELSEEELEISFEMPPSETKIYDLKRSIRGSIGFCERQQPNCAESLRKFITDNPEPKDLIQPILDHDYTYTNAGLLDFELSFRQGVNDDDIETGV